MKFFSSFTSLISIFEPRMVFREMEVVEVQLWYGKCGYSEQNDTNTEHLFIISKNNEKRMENKKKNQLLRLQFLTIADLSTTHCGENKHYYNQFNR